MLRNDGSSRCFGFVDFENPDEAERAITDLHSKNNPEGKVSTRNRFQQKKTKMIVLYKYYCEFVQTYCVGHAQKKAERHQELKRKFKQYNSGRKNRCQGINVFVKNLNDTFDDEHLRKEFSIFGTITSAKVKIYFILLT